MAADPNQQNLGEWFQNFFSEVMNQANDSMKKTDPLGSMKSIQAVSEAWTKNPNEVANAMQNWGQRVTEMNQNIWQNFQNQPFGVDENNSKFELSKLPYFQWVKEYYSSYAAWIEESIQNTPDLPDKTKEDALFWSKQLLSMMAPNNYFWTNPEAINQFVETKGDSLRKGYQNWLEDQKENGLPKMVDKSSFKLGENLAVTPGKVVYRNDLIELIQYAPMTKTVHEVPILITPPWINKYYILDLKPKKSLINYLVAQGFTVFIISWKNPTQEMRNTGMEEYLQQGPIAAMDVIKSITNVPKVHAVGYCIGGTLLASAIAWLNHKDNKHENTIESWSLLTTMLDFERPGDLGAFINEDALDHLDEIMSKQGYLDGSQMGTTMRMLRPDGLLWSYVINNYLYGKQPPPIDILFWNDDSTRMPEKMHSFYLRQYYLHNKLCKKDEIVLADIPIDLEKITQPLYCVSAEEDHIAPWEQVYRVNNLVKAPVRFVLSSSGHIAGVVNPPVDPPKRKYQAGNGDSNLAPQDWQQKQTKMPGTWWLDWKKWLSEKCGDQVAPPKMGNTKYKPLADAPGTYVLEQ